MGFFGEFNAWLNDVLLAYIGNNTARVASVLEPAVVTLGTIYVMVWGYMHLTGQIAEPLMAGAKKIVTLAIIFGVALQLWLYNTLIVDTFFNAPAALAAAIIGASDPVTTVDEIINFGAQTAELLLRKGGIFDGNVAYYLAGVVVYAIVGLTAIYTIFLFALSRIALSVLLALGPLFISLLLFDTSKRFFEAWLAQLTNYAFISILTVLVAALMMAVVGDAARQAVSTGGEITVAHAARVCMAAGLTFLVMRQVMPMAAGLASGLALSTFGAFSSTLSWAFGGALRSTGQFTRGLTDRETTRWDSYRRKSGYYVGQGARWLIGRHRRDNRVRG